MKKMYNTPNMELIAIYEQDVITTSIVEPNPLSDPFTADKENWI